MKKNYMKVSVFSVAAVLGVWIVGSALNCFNPTFIHISLEPIFNSWKTKEEETVFINKIQTITTKFINKVK